MKIFSLKQWRDDRRFAKLQRANREQEERLADVAKANERAKELLKELQQAGMRVVRWASADTRGIVSIWATLDGVLYRCFVGAKGGVEFVKV